MESIQLPFGFQATLTPPWTTAPWLLSPLRETGSSPVLCSAETPRLQHLRKWETVAAGLACDVCYLEERKEGCVTFVAADADIVGLGVRSSLTAP
jgi:hypothetical protein